MNGQDINVVIGYRLLNRAKGDKLWQLKWMNT